jgi:nucleotide-binding universal stress UspA family protein
MDGCINEWTAAVCSWYKMKQSIASALLSFSYPSQLDFRMQVDYRGTSPLPTLSVYTVLYASMQPSDIDREAARGLSDALHVLQRGFAEGIVGVNDCAQTLDTLQQLLKALEDERGVEATMAIRDLASMKSREPQQGKQVAVFLDGSSTSYAALRWAVEYGMRPEDRLHLVNIMPYEDFSLDAQRILQQAYDFAHFRGVAASQISTAALPAVSVHKFTSKSATGGVGEAVIEYVEKNNIDQVVLGSRGIGGGGIKGTLLNSLGMGSVSSFCANNLQCPVLIIKERAEGEFPQGEFQEKRIN